MTETDNHPDALARHIDTIEECYEFMLAYAAQGRTDEDPSHAPSIRELLTRMTAALEDLAGAAGARMGARPNTEAYGPFLDVLGDDARKSAAAIGVVLAHPSIGSQLIDNLNASIHLRALLTDLFLIDEAVKLDRGA